MKYVLLTHVPTFAGQSPGVVRLTEAFRDDLLAEAAALRLAGFDVTLATPRFEAPDARTLARERFVDVKLADHNLIDAPLPAYRTMRQFMAVKGDLADAITTAARDAGVVQMGAGGHPTALGQFAWPLVDRAKSKRVFVFAGDPLPERKRAIASGHNPAKRLGKLLVLRQFSAFLRHAIDEADLVFAHDPAVARRFSKEWNDHCHTFAARPIGDGDLIGPVALSHSRRHTLDPAHRLRVVAFPASGATAGLEHVLQAVAKARRLGRDITLTLAPGTALPNLPALRAELGLEKGVEISERPPVDTLDEADLFVSAPLIPVENSAIFSAAARGLPILSYRAGPADADVAEAGGAVLVERGNVAELSQALIDLCRDRQKLASMAESSRGWAAGVTRDATHRARAALVRTAVGL